MGTTANPLHILVAGGGIAGNAVALQLLRADIRVTIVERAAAPRPGGQAVDLRGPSREVAERMGLMPGIGKYQLDELGMSYVDPRGRTLADMSMEMFDGKGPVADIEFRPGHRRRRHSLGHPAPGVRAGGEVQHLPRRVHVVFTIPTPADVRPGWFTLQLIPGAAVGIRPDRDPATSKAILTMLTDPDPALRGDVAAQYRLIRQHLAGDGWHAPMILDAMATTGDFYFDELARIDMPTLNAGRVTLLGDAGYCGSPMTGMGTAMAIVGAYVLAGEIAATPLDLTDALRRYEEKVTPFLDKAKELPGGGISMMLSHSGFGTALRRTANRVMFSRALRPVMKKVFFGKTDDYELPVY